MLEDTNSLACASVNNNNVLSEDLKMNESLFYGWMDELGLSSTVFQSFRDDGRVNMKGSVQ